MGREEDRTMIAIERLSEIFVEVADTLVEDFDVIDFLQLVAARAAELSGGAVVGVVLADEGGRLHHLSASHESARALELVELQSFEGPCPDCYRTGEPVVELDLASASASERWPTFAPAAVRAGIHAVHAFPMRLRGRVVGALNVFGGDARELDSIELRVIQALADLATIALIQERTIARGEQLRGQLQGALNSRIVIEQAKGAVARSLGVSVDEAFELMRALARRDRAPLTQLAHELLARPETIPRLSGPEDQAPGRGGAGRG